MGLYTVSMFNEDVYEHIVRQKKPKYWRTILCKSMGAKASTCDDESNHVCYIRLGFTLFVILTNTIIMFGVLIK